MTDLLVIPKLTITVTKTANGQHNYLQIMSGDNFTVNVVLIADEIEVADRRSMATLIRNTKKVKQP